MGKSAWSKLHSVLHINLKHGLTLQTKIGLEVLFVVHMFNLSQGLFKLSAIGYEASTNNLLSECVIYVPSACMTSPIPPCTAKRH